MTQGGSPINYPNHPAQRRWRLGQTSASGESGRHPGRAWAAPDFHPASGWGRENDGGRAARVTGPPPPSGFHPAGGALGERVPLCPGIREVAKALFGTDRRCQGTSLTLPLKNRQCQWPVTASRALGCARGAGGRRRPAPAVSGDLTLSSAHVRPRCQGEDSSPPPVTWTPERLWEAHQPLHGFRV